MRNKIPQITLIAIIAIGAILFLYSFFGDEFNDERHNPMLVFTYVISILTLALALWGALGSVAAKPKSIKSVLINIGVFLAVLGLSYALADTTVTKEFAEQPTDGTVKWVGTGLYMLYIMMAGSVLAIVYSSINKMIK